MTIDLIKLTVNGLNIELKKLGNINYFVGKNGSGKSRIIQGIKNKISKNQSLQCDSNVDGTVGLSFRICELIISPNPQIKSDESSFQSTLAMSGQPLIERSEILLDTTTRVFPDGRNEVKENKEVTVLQNGMVITALSSAKFSVGTRYLDALTHQIFSWIAKMQDWRNSLPDGDTMFAILIDEIELHLHPSVQKKLHEILSERISQSGFAQNIVMFIATHSPFVISGIQNSSIPTKVYLIENNQTVDLYGNFNSEESQKGYPAQQALLTAHHLLGSSLNDFFPGKIIFCENSIAELIKCTLAQLDLKVETALFVTSGDDDSVQKSSMIAQQLDEIEKYCKSKPMEFLIVTKLMIFFDGPLEQDQRKHLEKIKKLSPRVVEATIGCSTELEQIYPITWTNEFLLSKSVAVWNQSQVPKIKNHLREAGYEGKNLGKLKADLAKFVAKKINSVEVLKDKVPHLYHFLINQSFLVESCDEN